MKSFLWLLILFVCLPDARAQIYADLTLSQGEASLGTLRILLHHDRVPRTVANFVGLATGERTWIDPTNGAVREGVPYYNGQIFHRLDHDFVLQGGDPLGTGTGGPGYVFQDEFDETLRHDGPYVVSMANRGVNSNGSQFFITLASTPFLDDLHSVFGTVIDDATVPGSRALVDSFRSTTAFPVDGNERPLTPVVIEQVVISGPDLEGFDVADPALNLPTVSRQAFSLEVRGAQTFLVWDRLDRRDMPVRSSSELANWGLGGNVLSMGEAAQAEVEVTALVNPAPTPTFFSFPVVDYSHTPVLPQFIYENGAQVVFETGGGNLTVTFDGAGGGTWSFEDSGGGVQSGAIQFGLPQNPELPPIPDNIIGVNGADTYARALSARDLVILFDVPVGPNQLNGVQPSLSFHTATSGWYTGPLDSGLTNPAPFKGRFTYVPAP